MPPSQELRSLEDGHGYWRCNELRSPPHPTKNIGKPVMLFFLGVVVGAVGVKWGDGMATNLGETLTSSTTQVTRMTPPTSEELPSTNTTLSPSDRDFKISWLMSFPNSGTSYTSGLVRTATLRFSATNYGAHNVDEELGISLPVFKESPYGPFWSTAGRERINATYTYQYPPEGYVITKTHCGARCFDCPPMNYFLTQHQFMIECLSGRYTYIAENGTTMEYKGHYDPDYVKSAIHLIRNPFNNVVSRFHLHARHKDEGYSNDREGFRSFCKYENDKYWKLEQEAAQLEQSILDILNKVPCRAEFLRYAQWHNFAFTVTRNLRLPTMVLHYEDYEYDFDQTLSKLMNFLHLEVVAPPREFLPGKDYIDYFTNKEKKAVKAAFKELAYVETWENIAHYFQ